MSDRGRVGVTAGAFDLCHYGHVLMFEECKEECDYLIVLVQSDPNLDRPEKNRPVQSMEERVGMVKSLKPVDEIKTYDTEADLYELLKTLDYDVRIIGADWKGKPFTGHDIEGHIEKCFFNSRDHGFSTSELRKRVYESEKLKLEKESAA